MEEAQITGQLEHPNTPPVHELGVDSQKRVFFAMKMVRGRSLAQILDDLRKNAKQSEREWPLSRLLNVSVSICNALAYSHSRCVIHRDLKPANVMVGDFGEVYVMDWGLAKVLDGQRQSAAVDGPTPLSANTSGSSPGKVSVSRDGDADLTQEGAVLGTPVYMPPEQAMGKVDAIDPRSDIYSLGAILYEILALQPPVDKNGGYLSILMQVSEGQIALPEQRNQKRAIPKELSAIAMKALAKEPQARYQTAEALRKDIERFQEGRSVSAKDDTKWEMLWKFAKRNKGFAAGAMMTLGVLLFGLFFLATAYAELRSERKARQDQGKASIPSFVRAGRMLVSEGRFEDALAQADVALDFNSRDADAQLLRGHVLIGQLRYSDAHEALTSYLTSNPDDSAAKTLAEGCKQINKHNTAEMFALADELNRQRLFGVADEVTRQAEQLVTSREELLPVYRKRIEAAWPGCGDYGLDMDKDGRCRLILKDCKQATDLAPLQGIPLKSLELHRCPVRDLTPLQRLPLARLVLYGCPEKLDLSPLAGLSLTEVSCDSRVQGVGVLRTMKSLTKINSVPVADFWKQYDNGEIK